MDGDVRVAALSGRTRPAERESSAVREESHLEEMRTAIRGDFARLAERRGDQELMRVTEPEDEEPDVTPVPPLPEVVEEEQERRSWFARFVSH